MIGEPSQERQGFAQKPRNNNLLCFAALMFIIGFSIIQLPFALADMGFYYLLNPAGLVSAIGIGAIVVLIGVLLLWKWYKSGI